MAAKDVARAEALKAPLLTAGWTEIDADLPARRRTRP